MSAPSRFIPKTDAPGLRWSDATAGYGDVQVLSGASLEVARGEFVGLIGPNGAGKSTLLRTVTGEADLGDSASLQVCGIPLSELSAPDRARLVGVVPQSLPELFAFTAREFVMMGRHPHLGRFESPSPRDIEVANEAMERTDTARLADAAVDTLSGGDLQRLTLAQALAQEPEVLLLDEPTSHLDLNHRLQILDLVSELAAGGLAVLGVFHDLDLAARYSDRVAIVSGGAVAPADSPAEVITARALLDVFSVRAVVGTDPVIGTVSVTPVIRESVSAEGSGPSVFVVGGSGAAADIMRRLALAGYQVRSGALNSGDVDQAVAETLGIPHLCLAPFAQLDEDGASTLTDEASACDICIVCDVPFGRANIGNLRAVVESASPVILLGEVDEGRDFAGGEAIELVSRALFEGAIVVHTGDEVLERVSDLTGHSEG